MARASGLDNPVNAATKEWLNSGRLAIWAPRIAWLGALFIGLAVRLSHFELSEFSVDQQTALHYARVILRGWEFPLIGMASSMGPTFGPGEYYLMVLPQLIGDAPEVSILYVIGLGILAGVVFSLAVWRYLGAWFGVTTMLLFSTGPWAIYFTRKIWTPDTLPLFGAVAFALLVYYLIHGRWWALALLGFTIGFAIQVHHSAVGMVPGAGLTLLVFLRRLRVGHVVAAGLAFAIPQSLYIYHLLNSGSSQFSRLLNLYGSPPRYDLSSFDLFQSLLSGAHFIDGLGATYPAQVSVPEAPGAVAVISLATWLGCGVLAWDLVRRPDKGKLSGASVFRVAILLWVLVPLAVTIRHPFQMFLRYQLYLLPIGFALPAAFFVWLPRAFGRLRSSSGLGPGALGSRFGIAASALLLLYVAGAGLLRFEAVQRTIPLATFPTLGGEYDSSSMPFLSTSRESLSRLESIISPEYETVVTSERLLVERGALQYLIDNRYRIRFSDVSDTLVIPHGPTRFALLPDAERLAGVARQFGAADAGASLVWPPDEVPATVLDMPAVTMPRDIAQVSPGQVLPVGLELVSYRADTVDERTVDLITVWRLARPEWATSPFWFYNSFAHLYTLSGKKIEVEGEVELPITTGWDARDTFILPFRLTTKQPLPLGLYRADVGVYVRNPARAPISLPAGTRQVATIENVRLGTGANIGTAAMEPFATFGDAIRLASSSATLRGDHLSVDLLWEATGRPPFNFTVFAHVYNASGNLVAQSDGWPASGNYPTSAWKAGDLVPDPRAIVLPPNLLPGNYTVAVGMYDSATMQRLAPSPDHGNRSVVVGVVEVTP